jgi:hypothetical protein
MTVMGRAKSFAPAKIEAARRIPACIWKKTNSMKPSPHGTAASAKATGGGQCRAERAGNLRLDNVLSDALFIEK